MKTGKGRIAVQDLKDKDIWLCEVGKKTGSTMIRKMFGKGKK